MALVLEILKCILCCADENIDDENESYQVIPFGISRVYNTFSSRISTPRVQFDRTTARLQNDLQDNRNSSVIISTRRASSDLPIHSRVVSDSQTSNPSSTGLTRGKGVERIYQEPFNPKSSSTYPNFPPPPSQRSVSSLSKLTPSPSSHKTPASASKPSSSSSITPTSFPSPGKTSSIKLHLPSPNPSPTFSKPSAASINLPSPSPKLPSSSVPSSSSPSLFQSFKPTLAPSSTTVRNYPDKDKKEKYIQVEFDPLHIYMVPENIEDLIKKNIVPEILKKPLSPSTYKDFFAALLYAEDFYIKKWSNFQLLNVTLELHEAPVYETKDSGEKDDKIFVAFEVDSTSQKRPNLLLKDSVFAQPSGRKVAPFQGVIYRVMKRQKSKTVLVEFGEDFRSQHHKTRKYDISFSFNRDSLERAHKAIAAASDPLFQKLLFPNRTSRIATCISLLPYSHKLDLDQNSVVHQMLNFQGPPPFLVVGQPCVSYSKLSRTGLVIVEAILQIYKHCPESQVLVCATINSTCDMLMTGLKRSIPESDMFQVNAAIQEIGEVPIDSLKKFRVVLSTFLSSYCLHDEGITAGHFNYIFLVDATFATEPETMVALANLADEKTAVIASGALKNHSIWGVRSDLAWQNGLGISYFERLSQSDPYRTKDPRFILYLI